MPDELAARLNEATARLIGRAVTPEDRFGLAVSGGADSMAMLAMAARIWPGQIESATVDHGLRPEARDEARMVADWCAGQGIAHAILHPSEPISGNLQAQARAARYALLDAWRVERGLHWLLTAHQADDQIETLILRLNRGSGIGGLASVRTRRGAILRPLLGLRRAELRGYCVAQAVPFVDDPSNADARFDRVRLRQALAGTELFDTDGLARSLDALGEAAAALDWMADRLEADLVAAEEGILVLEAAGLPRELLRRLLGRMIAKTNPDAEIPRGPSIDQALLQLFDGKAVTLADCVVTGGARWSVRRAPPRRVG